MARRKDGSLTTMICFGPEDRPEGGNRGLDGLNIEYEWAEPEDEDSEPEELIVVAVQEEGRPSRVVKRKPKKPTKTSTGTRTEKDIEYVDKNDVQSLKQRLHSEPSAVPDKTAKKEKREAPAAC